MSPKPRHVSFREVADLVDGVLEGARRVRVEAHLATSCTSCTTALERAQGLVSTLRSGPLPQPPPAARRRAGALFGRAWRRSAARQIREAVASLLVDQRLAPAAALRGTAPTGRQLLWVVPGAEIVIGLFPRETTHDVLGQVLPDDDSEDATPTRGVELLRDGECVARCTLDSDGAFEARGVRPGTYVLRGRVEAGAFRTPPFVVA